MACNFHRNPNHETICLIPPVVHFFAASRSIITIYQYYGLGDYYTISFIALGYSAFLLLQLCIWALQRLPPHDRSKRKKYLHFAYWFLFSFLMFGVSHYFGPLFKDRVAGYSLYAISILGSAFMFYVRVIWEEPSGCDQCLVEEKVREGKNQDLYYSEI